jgi:CRP-like cAMP-binding protein
LHVLQHGAHWLGGPKAGSGGNDNNVPVDSPSSARDILNLRASVLDSDDRVRLVGETQEESDKSLLLFAPNEIAFKRGVHYERALYQVVQGVCAAEDESGVVVARFKQGEMFGELAFLLHMQNHLNIRALTKLELRQFTAASLEDKFEKYPGLGARFYEFLCYHEISFMNSQLVIDSRRRASAVEASGAAATHPKE